jgi:hypothetical protein
MTILDDQKTNQRERPWRLKPGSKTPKREPGRKNAEKIDAGGKRQKQLSLTSLAAQSGSDTENN